MSPPRAVVGLEVHARLRTATKLFCRCPNRAAAPPNTLVCPVCLGHPGTLPMPNRQAVDLAVLLALALGARVAERSGWARKAYSYPVDDSRADGSAADDSAPAGHPAVLDPAAARR